MLYIIRIVALVSCVAALTACKSSSTSSTLPLAAGDSASVPTDNGGGNGNGAGNSDNGGGNKPAPPGYRQELVAVDLHTRQTPALPAGEFELLSLSTFPEAVSGGDVLLGLRGIADGQQVALTLNGVAISPTLTREEASGELRTLISGLTPGSNVITASTGTGKSGRRVQLTVKNHPITGPIISGPHQSPFYCRTSESGLGAPRDANCSIDTVYQWFYRQSSDLQYVELDPKATTYPDDLQMTTTKEGESVPFIVRVESSTINRGIARIGVLDDPIARGGKALPFTPHWNRRVYYIFGESCGVGYQQGKNTPNFVLGAPPNFPAAFREGLENQDPDAVGDMVDTGNILINLVGGAERLGKGDIVVHSTLSAFGVHCNPFVSMETTMMLKEHITEQYGVPEQFIGTNGSGAALQQYNAANNAPGLLTAAMPTATFADIASTAMTVTDCGLLVNYFANSSFDWTSPQKRAAVSGHNAQTSLNLDPLTSNDSSGQSSQLNNEICKSWVSTFFDRVQPTKGCSVPEAGSGDSGPAFRYHPTNNPGGTRCTIQDANVNWLGTQDHPDIPGVKVARRPLDNIGVQYGLQALRDGVISAEEFLDLNSAIGGLDIDGNFVTQRHAMSEDLASLLHRVGQVIGRGSLAETPILDLAPYIDLIPLLNIHESVRPFTIRARLNARAGREDTQVIWRGVLTQPDAFETIDAWTEAIRQNPSANRINDVASLRPSGPVPYAATDSCSFATLGGQLDLPGALLLPLGGQAPLIPGTGAPSTSIPFAVNAPETWNADGSGNGPCANLLPVVQTPRIAADMPMSDDVLKCQLKAIAAADYNGKLNAAQLARLGTIFPKGVCDYSKPGVGDLAMSANSLSWPAIGGSSLLVDGSGKLAPTSLQWRAARSRPAAP